MTGCVPEEPRLCNRLHKSKPDFAVRHANYLVQRSTTTELRFRERRGSGQPRPCTFAQ